MSRYYDSDWYEENFNNECAFWEANQVRALKGKRGRKVLAELREALYALPEHRLISSALCTVNPVKRSEGLPLYAELNEVVRDNGEGVCAIGAYLWHKKVKAGMDPAAAFDELPTITSEDGGLDETARLAKAAGVVFSLAWNIAYRNDEDFKRATPEERWRAMVDWIDRELAS